MGPIRLEYMCEYDLVCLLHFHFLMTSHSRPVRRISEGGGPIWEKVDLSLMGGTYLGIRFCLYPMELLHHGAGS